MLAFMHVGLEGNAMKIRSLILTATLALPLTALAGEATQQEPSSPAAAAAESAPAKSRTECTTPTGTRIRPSVENGCQGPRPYRTYSAKELERTGAFTVSESLRKLDPIFH